MTSPIAMEPPVIVSPQDDLAVKTHDRLRSIIRSHSPVSSDGDRRSPSPSGERDSPRTEPGTPPGLQLDSVYDEKLPPWRAVLRRKLVERLSWESIWLANMQTKYRTPFLDSFFLWTSVLGTTVFFMTFLPMFFFFGNQRMGRSAVNVLALGTYVSSFIKDLVCAPRPLAPVVRLSLETHHLEYGFVSSHSTSATSMTIHLGIFLANSGLPLHILIPLQVVLSLYCFSVIVGRLYCGMHSIADVLGGTVLGALLSLLVWGTEDIVEKYLTIGSWHSPVMIMGTCLFLVSHHPEPVDDCPCFEDAIAFLSVIAGASIGRWHGVAFGFPEETFFVTRTPGGDGTGIGYLGWIGLSVLKIALGISVLFIWRLAAKEVLRVTLPRIYRVLGKIFVLPNRAHYTPATDYKTAPQDPGGLFAVPSVLNLQLPSEVKPEKALGKNIHLNHLRARGRKEKAENGSSSNLVEKVDQGDIERRATPSRMSSLDVTTILHYDSAVLTKVIVYFGIGFLATEVVPILFELAGLGMY